MIKTTLITLALCVFFIECHAGNLDKVDSSANGYLQAEWEAFKARTGIVPLNEAQETRMRANWAKAKARVDENNANPNSSEKETTYDFDVLSG